MITIVIVGVGVVLGLVLGMFLATNAQFKGEAKNFSVEVINEGDKGDVISLSSNLEYLHEALKETGVVAFETNQDKLEIVSVRGYDKEDGFWVLKKDGKIIEDITQEKIVKKAKYQIVLEN